MHVDSRVDVNQYQEAPHPVLALGKDYPVGARNATGGHRHSRAQLLYAVEGLMRVGTQDNVWIIPPLRALWVPPDVWHEVVMSTPVSLRSLYIAQPAAARFGERCRVLEVSGLLRESILALVDEAPDYPLNGRGAHLAALALYEIERAPSVPIGIPWPQDRRLRAVCEAVLREPGASRTIEEWADGVGASPRTLTRLFSRETGLGYRQWLRQVHLAEAMSRLARGESIGRIAASLGYASQSAFTAMFRRALGATPKHYSARP